MLDARTVVVGKIFSQTSAAFTCSDHELFEKADPSSEFQNRFDPFLMLSRAPQLRIFLDGCTWERSRSLTITKTRLIETKRRTLEAHCVNVTKMVEEFVLLE